MALIHEKMYESKDLAHINIEDYFRQLVSNLIDNYRLNQSIDLDIQVDISDLGLDTLTPLGLIVNEIISNALKHGMKGRDEGKIILHLQRLEGRTLNMRIGDDGPGLPENVDFEEVNTFGLELVHALAEQLEGEIKLLDGPGALFELTIEDRIRTMNIKED